MAKNDPTRADEAALRKADREQRHAKLSLASKTERLGRIIAESVIARGAFSEIDLLQAGFSKEEGQSLYQDALSYARQIEPNIDSRVALL